MTKKSKGPLKLLSLLWLSSLINGYRKNMHQLTKIKTATFYLHAMQGFRKTIVVFSQLVLSTIFLVAGIIILHLAIFSFASEGGSSHTRLLLILGGIEFVGSFFLLCWFLSSRRWVQLAIQTNATLKDLLEHKKEL